MNAKGKILEISRDWKTGKSRVSLQIDKDVCEELDKLTDKELSVSIQQYREKRSLDANAYYWVLAGKLARVLDITNAAMHNILLRRYGAPEIINGELVYIMLPDTDEAEEKALESETYHVRPTSEVRVGERMNYRTYIMMKGSSTYNTKEMSDLIEGLISDCKDAGIETATPEEIERMMALYEKKHNSGS